MSWMDYAHAWANHYDAYLEKRAGRGLSTLESSTSPLASDQGQYNPPAVSGASPDPASSAQLEAQWALEPRKFEALPAWDEFLAWGAVARCQEYTYPGAGYDLYLLRRPLLAGMKRVK